MNFVFGAGVVKKAVEVRFHCGFRVRSFNNVNLKFMF